MLPAIVLPLAEKQDFICPDRHVEVLKREMAKVDQILVIGWSAGDPLLLQMMEDIITQPVSVAIVSGSEGGVNIVKERLGRIKQATFAIEYIRFYRFIASDECSIFFAIGK